MTANRKSLPMWRIMQGTSRCTVHAADYAGALERGGAIGFHKPDSVCLMEDAEQARAKAIAAHRTLPRSSIPIPLIHT